MKFSINAQQFAKHIDRVQKNIQRKTDKAIVRALNDTAKTTQTRGIRALSSATGYKVGRLKSRSKVVKANSNRLISYVYFDVEKPLNITALKGTRINAGGTVSYKFGNKRYRKRGFLVNIGGRTLAVRNIQTGKNYPKFKRAARGRIKTASSGKRYTSGRIASITGPSVYNVFKERTFRNEIQAIIAEHYKKRFNHHMKFYANK